MYAFTLLAILPLAAAVPSPIVPRAPVLEVRGAEIVPGKYIVKMKDGTSTAALNKAVAKIGKTSHVYTGGFKGFAGHIDDKTLEEIQSLPEVRVRGGECYFKMLPTDTGIGRIY